MSEVIEVRVCAEEFNAAEADDCVYGETSLGTVTAYVYIELGYEREYIDHANDDLDASYRIFFNSTIFYAKTQEDIDASNYEASLTEQIVKIKYKPEAPEKN